MLTRKIDSIQKNPPISTCGDDRYSEQQKSIYEVRLLNARSKVLDTNSLHILRTLKFSRIKKHLLDLLKSSQTQGGSIFKGTKIVRPHNNFISQFLVFQSTVHFNDEEQEQMKMSGITTREFCPLVIFKKEHDMASSFLLFSKVPYDDTKGLIMTELLATSCISVFLHPTESSALQLIKKRITQPVIESRAHINCVPYSLEAQWNIFIKEQEANTKEYVNVLTREIDSIQENPPISISGDNYFLKAENDIYVYWLLKAREKILNTSSLHVLRTLKFSRIKKHLLDLFKSSHKQGGSTKIFSHYTNCINEFLVARCRVHFNDEEQELIKMSGITAFGFCPIVIFKKEHDMASSSLLFSKVPYE